MTVIQRPPPTIVVPSDVVTCLHTISGAVGQPLTLVGGWAVGVRLRMGRADARPTEDLDVLLTAAALPAGAALAAARAIQDDPSHPCRLSGLPMLVDLLTDNEQAVLGVPDQVIEDEDGLRLLVPPLGRLMAATAEPVVLASEATEGAQVAVGLPRAGALFAAKVMNITLWRKSVRSLTILRLWPRG